MGKEKKKKACNGLLENKEEFCSPYGEKETKQQKNVVTAVLPKYRE